MSNSTRWNIKIKDLDGNEPKLIAEPNTCVMTEYVNKAVIELQKRLAQTDEPAF